ncbi:hypothetical protein INT48_003685 [Thamnidium elegans]|uniref:Fork-head domain-containing protein n=1 Tax=Thamnidium elegans TaxID=101142 RepID=A0A8H7SNC7_9FUNG|nr:hypothetical protein INT48_003685 [Thamnidium elegans]
MLNQFNNSSQTSKGCSVIHSFPFIKDGPSTQTLKDCTRQVPTGPFHIKPAWTPVKLDEKPPFSYATLIAHAILSSEYRKLTLNEIYQWISEQYPCYSMNDHRWQNSIRHNLSLQKAFSKLDRTTTSPSGKGCFWTILPGYEQQFIDNLVKNGLGNSRHYRTNKITSHKQLMETHKSHCDSGVDVQEIIPSKKENSLLDDFFTSQYSSAVYLDNISAPSSVIDQNMFSSLDWPIPQFNNELYFDTNYLDNLDNFNNSFLPSFIIPQDPSYLLYDQ